jgi:hypothetical protein
VVVKAFNKESPTQSEASAVYVRPLETQLDGGTTRNSEVDQSTPDYHPDTMWLTLVLSDRYLYIIYIYMTQEPRKFADK